MLASSVLLLFFFFSFFRSVGCRCFVRRYGMLIRNVHSVFDLYSELGVDLFFGFLAYWPVVFIGNTPRYAEAEAVPRSNTLIRCSPGDTYFLSPRVILVFYVFCVLGGAHFVPFDYYYVRRHKKAHSFFLVLSVFWGVFFVPVD